MLRTSRTSWKPGPAATAVVATHRAVMPVAASDTGSQVDRARVSVVHARAGSSQAAPVQAGPGSSTATSRSTGSAARRTVIARMMTSRSGSLGVASVVSQIGSASAP